MGDRYMISGQLNTEDKILSVRENLFQICPKNKYRLIDPHITIIPPFELPSDLLSGVEKIIEKYSTQTFEICIEGVGVYPHLDNPRVILLDVTAGQELIDFRQRLVTFFQENNVDFRYDPTPFHITLFKCDNGYTLAEDRKQLLQNRVYSNRESWENKLSKVCLESVT